MIETILFFCVILFIGYLVIFFYLLSGIQNLDNPHTEQQPQVSIVVSMHNEEKNAADLLDHLIHQDYPKEKLEIILVNDRSTDNTAQILANKKQQFNQLEIITINNLIRGFAPKKRAIDVAVRQANGEIILLTDADGRPGKKWVSAMVSYFSENTGMVIGYAPYFANNFFQKLLALEYFSHASIAAATTGLNYPLTCVGTNIAYRKKTFLELNGFGQYKNIHTGDDDLFLQRVRDESQWQIKYATSDEAKVYNAPPATWKKFYNQRLRYASKGFKYPAIVTLALTGYYFFNLLLCILGVLSLLTLNFPLSLMAIFFGKALVEYVFLKKSGTVLNETRVFSVFPAEFLLHIPYVVYFGLLGNVQKFEWSGVKQ